MTALESVTAQMLTLSPGERHILLQSIVESLHEDIDPDYEEEMAREAQARLDAYDRGETDSVDAFEFNAMLRERLLRKDG